MNKEETREREAIKLSKNSSGATGDKSLLPRSVGAFTVNVCRNPHCPSFALPPILFSVDRELFRGRLKGTQESRSYICNACGSHTRIKSNTALMAEYARLRTMHRGTSREYCPNEACSLCRVPADLMPSGYRRHGKTPNGDPRFQCKSCKRTFSAGRPTRRHRETSETTLILKLLVNNVPFSRILEIADISAQRLYDRIDFLERQCRAMAAYKDAKMRQCLRGRNVVFATDVQTILVNWRHAHRILNVPVLHAVTAELDSGFIMAATTDFDPNADPEIIDRDAFTNGDYGRPRAWREQGRVWGRSEYADSILRGMKGYLSDEEKHYASNIFDLPGRGTRIRGDVFQAAHLMLVINRLGRDYRQATFCIDGDAGLARLACALGASAIKEGRLHVAEIKFAKGLGNRERDRLKELGADLKAADTKIYADLMNVAANAYNLTSESVQLIAARLLADFGALHRDDRSAWLAKDGYEWKYHKKEEPEKVIRLLTDLGHLDFGSLAILLSRASLAPADKYFAQARRRVPGFSRGARPTSGETTWYETAFYDPATVGKMATILRFYHNYMLVEAKGPKAERRTPAMKLGLTKGRVYPRDVLSFR